MWPGGTADLELISGFISILCKLVWTLLVKSVFISRITQEVHAPTKEIINHNSDFTCSILIVSKKILKSFSFPASDTWKCVKISTLQWCRQLLVSSDWEVARWAKSGVILRGEAAKAAVPRKWLCLV